MKAIKKVFAILLAAAMVLSLGAAAFAVETTGGTITITNAKEGQTYNAYKIFDLTYATDEEGNVTGYSYTATADQQSFYEGKDGNPFTFTKNVQGTYNVSIKTDTSTGNAYTEAEIIEFFQQFYTEDENTTGTYVLDSDFKAVVTAGTEQTANSSTVTFDNLTYGYYLVTSSLSALVTIDSTTPSVEVVDKNVLPQIDKQVQENSQVDETNGGWGGTNDASIGDTVTFQVTITTEATPKDYILHDTMSEGLTFGSVTGITLTTSDGKSDGDIVDTEYYEVKTTGLTDDCTFEVIFKPDFLNTLSAYDKLIVTYTATVNEEAVIEGSGNTNKVELAYKDANGLEATPIDKTTTTYVYDFDLYKYTTNDGGTTKTVLEDAEFTLTKENETEALYFVKSTKTVGEETVTVYTLADSTTASASQTITAGKITIKGLDAGTYTLTETEAPDGYNPLEGDITVTIGGTVESTGEVKKTLTQDEKTVNQVEVENQTGTELPSTGGIGTTIFYVIGSILVIGAAVLLIVKRRMNGSEE